MDRHEKYAKIIQEAWLLEGELDKYLNKKQVEDSLMEMRKLAHTTENMLDVENNLRLLKELRVLVEEQKIPPMDESQIKEGREKITAWQRFIKYIESVFFRGFGTFARCSRGFDEGI